MNEEKINTEEELDRIPAPLYSPTSSNYSIREFIRSDKTRWEDCQLFNGEWLFRFKIPPFQRGFVWTEEQSIKFIESAWLGFSLGTYLVNKVETWVKVEGKEYLHPFDDYLLDGLQRMNAIHRYVNNEFPVFGLYWNELTKREKRRFENIEFTQSRVFITDEEKLKELYNRLNFGGTPHTEADRAK